MHPTAETLPDDAAALGELALFVLAEVKSRNLTIATAES